MCYLFSFKSSTYFFNAVDLSRLNKSDLSSLPWRDIQNILSIEGEALSFSDMNACITALVGQTSSALETSEYTPLEFADQILGLED